MNLPPTSHIPQKPARHKNTKRASSSGKTLPTPTISLKASKQTSCLPALP
ncbi:hypothetical protein Fmac_014780 [Flemingia macrophylla]|uniref:Uncharacterized protein n=1 Tax=Flemingia macrophylla TaxID=520843 RepID=A0ABD1MCP3_9FABA